MNEYDLALDRMLTPPGKNTYTMDEVRAENKIKKKIKKGRKKLKHVIPRIEMLGKADYGIEGYKPGKPIKMLKKLRKIKKEEAREVL